MKKNEKKRIDQLMVERGLTDSREKARRLLMAGLIRVGGEMVTKPGKTFPIDSSIAKEKEEPFVSRAGEKLSGLLKDHPVSIKDKICMDVGASTGGFTDCLLQNGAKKVFAIDVGKGLIDWKLRNDPRVVLLEKVNARYLKEDSLPEPCDICTMDVSFISIEKIIPAVYNLIVPGGFILALIKPQFEAGRENVGKKGIIKDESVHARVIERIKTFSADNNLEAQAVFPSKIKGAGGNQEFFIVLKK